MIVRVSLFVLFIFCLVVMLADVKAAEQGNPLYDKNDDPEHRQQHDLWINSNDYKSPIDGSHCCGKEDCKIVPELNVRITPNGYALSNGELVPYAEVQISEDGDYWRCKRHDGSRRCFFAPTSIY